MKITNNNELLVYVNNADLLEDGTYCIASSVTYIDHHAFRNCTDLKKVILPEHVNFIGDHVLIRVPT